MLHLNKKYKSITGKIIFLAYLTFLITGVFHHHNYSLLVSSQITNQTENPESSYSDILNVNGISNCLLHNFSQTIINYYFGSQDLIYKYRNLSFLKSEFNSNGYSSNCKFCISLRAPPLSPINS